MTSPTSSRAVLSWALYDFANSAFATTVMAGFFPIFFKDHWSAGALATESTFWLGVTVSSAGLIVALAAPLLGAMADTGGTKKRSLGIFASLGILATAALFFVPGGAWPAAAFLYGLATIGFHLSIIFYDSLIISVSTPATVDSVSARGYALGYLGGGLLFLLNVIAVQNPSLLGLAGQADAVRFSFLSVAVWWALFSVPLMVAVPEPPGGRRLTLAARVREGLRQLSRTLRHISKYRMTGLFLVAYWFYIDGVDTVVTMAVDYGKAVGFGTGELISALLMVQFLGVPFSFLMGFLGRKLGTKTGLMLCILVYIAVTVIGSRLDLTPYRLFGFEVSTFYAVAFLVAIAQGGIQALSRSFYSRIIPPALSAEFFGFYNMLGKFATIVGPLMMGVVGRMTGSPRMGIQAIAILFVVGLLLLIRVDENRAREEAAIS
jgi:UMF1 family MFS transporter